MARLLLRSNSENPRIRRDTRGCSFSSDDIEEMARARHTDREVFRTNPSSLTILDHSLQFSKGRNDEKECWIHVGVDLVGLPRLLTDLFEEELPRDRVITVSRRALCQPYCYEAMSQVISVGIGR